MSDPEVPMAAALGALVLAVSVQLVELRLLVQRAISVLPVAPALVATVVAMEQLTSRGPRALQE